jgi:hypothetical protein
VEQANQELRQEVGRLEEALGRLGQTPVVSAVAVGLAPLPPHHTSSTPTASTHTPSQPTANAASAPAQHQLSTSFSHTNRDGSHDGKRGRRGEEWGDGRSAAVGLPLRRKLGELGLGVQDCESYGAQFEEAGLESWEMVCGMEREEVEGFVRSVMKPFHAVRLMREVDMACAAPMATNTPPPLPASLVSGGTRPLKELSKAEGRGL